MAIYYNDTLDRTFHALGDNTRRQILSMLTEHGAASAGELAKPFNASQPTISKHLKVLENAGLIKRMVDGRIHRFEIATGPLQEAMSWIQRHESFWQGSLSRLDKLIEDEPT